MQLLRLSLENWRGVVFRNVEFSAGVTLIEGPNEIGKSTVVEAIQTLFTELDSSNKKHIKAIQPAGNDVGSRVEVEIKAGNYHFVYSKTYNKLKKTTLDVIAPVKKQLTGREAHEQVEQMLAETVDMALWNALLVDQGEKVSLANIHESAGLANALDEAAGSASDGVEDTDMYGAVQAEYEKYFTLKTGKNKFNQLEAECEKTQSAFESATQSLAEVEADSAEHDRSAAEVARLKNDIPVLQAKLDAHEKNWHTIQSVQQQVEAKKRQLESAQLRQKTATDEHTRRVELIKEIQSSQASLNQANLAQDPLKSKTEQLKEQAGNAQLVIKDIKKKTRDASQRLELAQDDVRYVQNLESLSKDSLRVDQLNGIETDMKLYLGIEAAIAMTDTALEEIRQAEGQVSLMQRQRDTAATTISVTAEKPLDLEVDGNKISLKKEGIVTRTIASQTHIRLPGVASLQITPSHSVAELQDQAEDAQASLARLLDRYGVGDLNDAVAQNQKRVEAQREIDRLKIRENEILQGANKAELVQMLSSLKSECDTYVERRKSTAPIPSTTLDATRQVTKARTELAAQEIALDNAQEKVEVLQKDHDAADAKVRVAEQNLAGLKASVQDRQARLDKEQLANSDEELAAQVKQATELAEQLNSEYEKLNTSLREASPDSVEARLSNAKDVFNRANVDLVDAEKNLAVLTDRLQQAQADGRFETCEMAKRAFEECQSELEATQRRAAAAELLWTTLNMHRDSSRQAYVQPLKAAIERLGAIVFGADFEVALGDDWSLESRTLNGITLRFDDLSIGAKEQLGILMRLAAAQIVSTQGGVPLIIDDALGFSDPSRLETMGAAIAAAGKQSQIIILTCTPGRFMHVGSAQVVKFAN